MDFFQRQDNARRKTGLLALLFIIAVFLVVAAVNGAVFLVFNFSNAYDFNTARWWLDGPAAYTAIGTLLVIFAGSLTRYVKLGSGGGVAVAKMAGAERVDLNSRSSEMRTYINIVEEMSIAAGLPVPEIFIMPKEKSINAFVAGYTPADTVVVITQGALETLSRDELQGVIGHEFSHVLHADTLINLRLMALLAGIVFVGDIGQFLMRSSSRSRHSTRRSKEEGGMFLLGLALVVIGYVGVLMGRIIKAAVSRQREFLADASSVQFTRNPEGIAGALFKIDQHGASSFLVHTVQAESMNHMCFGETIKMGFRNLLASHPPIRQRIDALGSSTFAKGRSKTRSNLQSLSAHNSKNITSGIPDETVGFSNTHKHNTQATAPGAAPELPPMPSISPQTRGPADNTRSFKETTGQVSIDDIDHARTLLQQLPTEVHRMAHSPSGAALIVISLLAQENKLTEKEIRNAYNHPAFKFHPVVDFTPIQMLMGQIDSQLRMPLLEICSPTLKMLSSKQRAVFIDILFTLAKSDGKMNLFEFLCLSFLALQLPKKVRKPKVSRVYKLNELGDELYIVLTLVYKAGMPHHDRAKSKMMLQDLTQRLCGENYQQPALGKLNTHIVSAAFEKLRDLSPLLKPVLLDATTDLILTDNMITTQEYELLRVIASCLDCPMPALMTQK